MSEETGSLFSAAAPLTPTGLLCFVAVEDMKGRARNFPEVLQAWPYWVIDPGEVDKGQWIGVRD